MAVTTIVDNLGVREINIPDDEAIGFAVHAPATIFGNLEVVSGSLITSGFAVSGSFEVPGNLEVGGDLTVSGTFSVPGNLSVGVLDASDVYTSDGLFVSGAATMGLLDAADLYLSNDLSVSGSSTMNAALTVAAGGVSITAGGLGVTAGGVSVTDGGLTVLAGSSEISGSLRVSGSFVQRQQYRTAGAGTYTVSIADDNQLIEVDPGGGASVLALPTDLDVGFFCYFRQVGTGTVSVSGSAGVTVNSTAGAEPSLTAQWGHATADKRAGAQWIVAGDIS